MLGYKGSRAPAVRLCRGKEAEHGMAEDSKPCLVGSNADDRNVLHELVAALLLASQKDPHLTRHCPHSHEGASDPGVC